MGTLLCEQVFGAVAGDGYQFFSRFLLIQVNLDFNLYLFLLFFSYHRNTAVPAQPPLDAPRITTDATRVEETEKLKTLWQHTNSGPATTILEEEEAVDTGLIRSQLYLLELPSWRRL